MSLAREQLPLVALESVRLGRPLGQLEEVLALVLGLLQVAALLALESELEPAAGQVRQVAVRHPELGLDSVDYYLGS